MLTLHLLLSVQVTRITELRLSRCRPPIGSQSSIELSIPNISCGLFIWIPYAKEGSGDQWKGPGLSGLIWLKWTEHIPSHLSKMLGPAGSDWGRNLNKSKLIILINQKWLSSGIHTPPTRKTVNPLFRTMKDAHHQWVIGTQNLAWRFKVEGWPVDLVGARKVKCKKHSNNNPTSVKFGNIPQENDWLSN